MSVVETLSSWANPQPSPRQRGSHLRAVEPSPARAPRIPFVAVLGVVLALGLFGLLVSNTDNHARNHGFLRTAAGWRLSPVFDVNPNPNPNTFAMPIDPGGNDDMQDAIAAGDAFRLTHHEAVAELRNVLRAVDGWRRKASDLGIDSRDINRMSAAFESSRTEHARRIVERDDADGDTVARRGSSGPQPRQPKGTSTGGRYTTKARTEPNVEL